VVTWPSGSVVLRIYNPSYPGFRFFGPLGQRFDHHEPDDPPWRGPRGIYYGAPTLACCVGEVFADRGFVQISDEWLAVIRIGRDIRLLDLRRGGATRAGTVHAISSVRDRALTQAWSRFFYEHPALYGLVDGVLYPAAHNGADAVALYERAADALTPPAAEVQVGPLVSPAIRYRIMRAARSLLLPYLLPARPFA
jgi:hypothetical protein